MAHRFFRSVAVSALVAALAVPAIADSFAGPYLAGRQGSYGSDYANSARYFSEALTRDPSNPALLENTVLAFMSLGQMDRAMPVARKLDAEGFQSQIAEVVITSGMVQDCQYSELLSRLETNGVGPLVDGLMKAWAHIGRGAMSEALAAFDAVATEPSLSGFSAYHKALALASVGDFEGAAEIFANADQNGLQRTRRGVMAEVEVLSQLERTEDALALLEEVFGGDLDPFPSG